MYIYIYDFNIVHNYSVLHFLHCTFTVYAIQVSTEFLVVACLGHEAVGSGDLADKWPVFLPWLW